jgi:hypothetical protein
MKLKAFRVISVVLIIFGVASIGAMLDDLSKGIREDTYLGTAMGAGFVLGGVLLFRAAKLGSRIGWRGLLGAFMVLFGMVGAGVEADNIANLRADQPIFGCVLAGIFIVSGFLLARSGRQQRAETGSSTREPVAAGRAPGMSHGELLSGPGTPGARLGATGEPEAVREKVLPGARHES